MPSSRISRHGMDVVFKLEAQQLGSALARRFGIDLPPVVRYFPTDLPVADVHLEQLDSVFELEDGRLLHLEFQTEYRQETLPRFLVYDALLLERYGRPITTVVFYGAGVAVAEAEIVGGAIQYRVYNVLVGQQDGEAIYQRLRARLAKGAGLTPEERLDLIFLPLMAHQRPRREIVVDTVTLARQLPQRQQRQAIAALIGLGHRFLAGNDLDTLLEGLMKTSIGQLLLDRGRQEGSEQTRQQDVLVVLETRFGPLPPTIGAQLARMTDTQRLEDLLKTATSVRSLEEFMQALQR